MQSALSFDLSTVLANRLHSYSRDFKPCVEREMKHDVLLSASDSETADSLTYTLVVS